MDIAFSLDQLFTGWFGFFAFATGILSVALLIPFKRFKYWKQLQYLAWPMGVATSASYFFLFRDWQLYGSMSLQTWFVLISTIGTWVWRGQLLNRNIVTNNRFLKFIAAPELETRHATLRYMAYTLGLAALALGPVCLVLQHYGDTAPFWDGVVFTLSGAAIWLQLRKFVQTWPLWIAVDLISIPLYLSQANGGTALLYVAYLILCFFGWWTWQREASGDVEEPVYDYVEPAYSDA